MKDPKYYKLCRFCCESIIHETNFCHHCCNDQRRWLKRPLELFNWTIFPLLFPLIFPLWLSTGYFGLFNNDFTDYSSQFITTSVNTIKLDEAHYSVVFKIENNTDKTWRDLTYQVIAKEYNKVAFSKEGSESSWIILPNTTSYLTVKLKDKLSKREAFDASWSLLITDLDEG